METSGKPSGSSDRHEVEIAAPAPDPRHLKGRLRKLLLADEPDLAEIRRELQRWNLNAAWPTLHVLKGLLREPALRQRRPVRMVLMYFRCVQRFLCLQEHPLADSLAPRALALAMAIGDRDLIEASKFRLIVRKSLMGHKREALEEASNHMPEMVERRGVEGALLVLCRMTDECCELGWHDRMREITKLQFLILHSAGSSVTRARMVVEIDAVEHAVLRAIDTRFNGMQPESALALAEARLTLEHSRRALLKLQARHFVGALARYESMICWLEGALDSTQIDRLIQHACAGPQRDEIFRFVQIRLSAALACIDRCDDERGRVLLEAALVDTRPGDFILRSTCLTLLAGVWARLGQWEAAFRCLEQADAVRTLRRDEALQSQLISMLGRLKRDNLLAIGFIGHDLRAPLSAIQAITEMPGERADGMERIRQLATKALDYADGYLRFVALQLIDDREFEPLDLRDVLDDVIDELKVAGPYRMLRIDVSDETAVVRSHFPTVRRVFANLLHNAAEASGPEGEVQIELSVLGPDAVVAMHDSGSGIPPDRLPTLFDDVVFRSSGKSTGHGLGLRFVARAVHALSGTVYATNRPAGGASVYVALPLAEALCGRAGAAE